jgi:hypothetical protein
LKFRDGRRKEFTAVNFLVPFRKLPKVGLHDVKS